MWKYAQAGLEDPATVFEQASGVIGPTPPDRYLQAFPHVHNAYIAGYVSYVELAKMAGQPHAAQEQELNRLLCFRADTFRWDVQADTGGITPLYQTHALFQAKAQIFHESRDRLARVLDTPLVPAGDLFYIQNLIATLEASSTSSGG